ncbi:MAG: Smr/MutS family protein [Alphaproteobacteria bacterium]
MNLDARLDLHGMTQTEAYRALRNFLETASYRGHRSVLIITGKGARGFEGSGVLKHVVPLWLNEPKFRSRILSFSFARPKHGGDGALYVLLKRKITS